MSSLAMQRSISPMGVRDASRLRGYLGFDNRSVGLLALLVSLASLVPVPIHAGEAGINVPMRRDVGLSTREAPDAAPEGILSIAEVVRNEVEILRQELGVNDFPARAESQQDRRPVHVYVKALEVMSKVVAVQRRMGVAPAGSVREVPLDGLSSDDVLVAVQDILDGIRVIKTQMVIESTAEAPVVSRPQTLSAAYKVLADASAMLDGLVGSPLAPAHVFRNVRAIVEDMNLIAAKLKVSLDLETPEVVGSKESFDVAQQALRAAYKVVMLQARLGMDASAVPTLTMVRVTPTEVYDLTGTLRAELARIKWHLAINVPTSEEMELTRHRDSTDVFAQMLLIVRNLDQLTAGLEN